MNNQDKLDQQIKDNETVATVLAVIAIMLAVAIGFIMFNSCKVLHEIPNDSTQVNIRDSVAVRDSVVIRDSLVVRDSLVLVPVPVETSQSVLPEFIPSHLETSVAESDAWVDSIGLHHTLSNRQGSLTAHVPVTEHYNSSEHYSSSDSHQSNETDSTHTEYVQVEKELTFWQKLRMGAFWWLVALAVVGWRRELLALFKLLLKLLPV